jgi:hypothetical protein
VPELAMYLFQEKRLKSEEKRAGAIFKEKRRLQ